MQKSLRFEIKCPCKILIPFGILTWGCFIILLLTVAIRLKRGTSKVQHNVKQPCVKIQLEPQGALIAHLSTMSTSVIS